jgi:DNA-binding FrmR family transcriptional regulator
VSVTEVVVNAQSVAVESPPAGARAGRSSVPAPGKRVRDRLRRAEGQVRGVQKMLDEGRSCEEVVTQLMAARSALDEAIRVILTERVAECIGTLSPDDARAAVSRAVGLLVRA